ncbi:VWA domain-containing protein [Lachnobacterium bovis]|uniref:VWA domain-containing protein n=1 Tax=Lachnobacterium bovis TaxID=140626 RepID=UPI0003B6DC4A|nr:VWA domain-containing protein [Lachnobacterium bovis]
MKPRTVCKKSLAVILAGLMMMGNIGSAGAENTNSSGTSEQLAAALQKNPVRVSLFKYKVKPDSTAQPSALREESTEKKEESTQKLEDGSQEKKDESTEMKEDSSEKIEPARNNVEQETTRKEESTEKKAEQSGDTQNNTQNETAEETPETPSTEVPGDINAYNSSNAGGKIPLQFIGADSTGSTKDKINQNHQDELQQGIFADELKNNTLAMSDGVYSFDLFNTVGYRPGDSSFQLDKNDYVTAYYNVDVSNLYEKNDNGVYEFDSSKKDMVLNKTTGKFEEPSQSAGTSIFSPFVNESTGKREFHFGVLTDFDFVIPKEQVRDENAENEIFEFGADDDIAVYIDSKKVVDLGGIHNTIKGKINLRTGKVIYFSENGSDITINDINDPSKKVVGNDIEYDLGTTYNDGLPHNMKIFYLERGASKSALKLKFKPVEEDSDSITAEKTADLVSADDRTYKINLGVAAKGIQHTTTTSSNIVLVLDTSNSMLYRNVKALSGTSSSEVYKKLDTLDKHRTYSSMKLEDHESDDDWWGYSLYYNLSTKDQEVFKSLFSDSSYVGGIFYGAPSDKTTLVRYDENDRKWYRYYFTGYKVAGIFYCKLNKKEVTERDCPSELYTTGMETMKDATKRLVDEIGDDSNLGIVLFDSGADVKQQVVNVGQNRTAIKSVIDKIKRVGAGGTYPSKGFTKANGLFDQTLMNNGKDNHVIFFSDGAAQDESDTIRAANIIKSRGITIWGINAVSDTYGIVQQVATKGKIVNVNGIENLAEAFSSIITSIEKQKGQIVDYIDDRFELVDNNNKPYKAGDVITFGDNIKGVVIADALGQVNGIKWENQELEPLDENNKTKWNVSFRVKAKDSYMGGYCIPTNGSSSCVMVGGTIKNFPIPTVDVPLLAGEFKTKEETYLLGTKVKNIWKKIRDVADQGTGKNSDFGVSNDVISVLMAGINDSQHEVEYTQFYNYGAAGDLDGEITYKLVVVGSDTCEDHRMKKEGKAAEKYTLSAEYHPYNREKREGIVRNLYGDNLGDYYTLGKDNQKITASGSYIMNVVPGSIEISKVISKEDYEKSKKFGDAIFTFKILFTPYSDELKDGKEVTIDDKAVELYQTVRFTDKDNYSLKADGDNYIITTKLKDLPKGSYKISELSTMGYKNIDVKATGGCATVDGKEVKVEFKDGNKELQNGKKSLSGNYEDLCEEYKASAKYTNSFNHTDRPTDTDVVKNSFIIRQQEVMPGNELPQSKLVDNDNIVSYLEYLIDIIEKANTKPKEEENPSQR